MIIYLKIVELLYTINALKLFSIYFSMLKIVWIYQPINLLFPSSFTYL